MAQRAVEFDSFSSLPERLRSLPEGPINLVPPHDPLIQKWLGDRPLTASVQNIAGVVHVDVIEAGRPNIGVGLRVGDDQIKTFKWGGHETYDIFAPNRNPNQASFNFAERLVTLFEQSG